MEIIIKSAEFGHLMYCIKNKRVTLLAVCGSLQQMIEQNIIIPVDSAEIIERFYMHTEIMDNVSKSKYYYLNTAQK